MKGGNVSRNEGTRVLICDVLCTIKIMCRQKKKNKKGEEKKTQD